ERRSRQIERAEVRELNRVHRQRVEQRRQQTDLFIEEPPPDEEEEKDRQQIEKGGDGARRQVEVAIDVVTADITPELGGVKRKGAVDESRRAFQVVGVERVGGGVE